MQFPILNGVYADETLNFRNTYPVNMIPVTMQSGISNGYLRIADGAVSLGTGAGAPRGGINWKDKCYRVSGSKLVLVDQFGQGTILGDVDNGERVTLTYSFDRLAICSNGKLFYWDGATLVQVVDVDLGVAKAVIWVDGYFMTTDGEFLIVTELGDPMSVNPLKYGSSEADPDPILTLLKLRGEVVAVNRYTLEAFNNVGGSLFPFARIEGALIQKGAIGPNAACVFADAVAFLGSGRNETPAIYMGLNGSVVKISTMGIDGLLTSYTNDSLSGVVLDTHVSQGADQLWVRLPDRTLVYDRSVSNILGEPVWFALSSAQTGFASYRVMDPVWCYAQWTVCDSQTGAFGIMDKDISTHFGAIVYWEFSTALLYNEGRGAVCNALELVCLTGRVTLGEDPVISTCYSLDGETWSQERPIKAGQQGDRMRRLIWFQQGLMRNWRIQKFIGDSHARLSVARLEIQLEGLGA